MEELLLKILDGQAKTENQLNSLRSEMKCELHNIKGDINNIKDEIFIMKGDMRNLQTDFSTIKGDMRNLQTDFSTIKGDMKNLQTDFSTMKCDIKEIKTAVFRIEKHQEETIVGMLLHVKKQVDQKDYQIKVLNQRLFDVEVKTETSQ
ncbi:hypothetical protein BKP37_08670 [Anaerobacillus alkalilacustris]|uniref:Uncharacterized protein n=1 Tax=Anaerobacillus alkalilacustris TaxID=393763 RepID=A0A1S2LPV4_9BACI|nr:hypothetical protein [Anaerobacillus alkalilacustris]OIJ14406.1 hypothetical protein BKP37_08670 [Anaerobacillus alkalilacustris]